VYRLKCGKVLNFVIPDRVFFPVSIGARSVKIHHETLELRSQIKWHVFMVHGLYSFVNIIQVIG